MDVDLRKLRYFVAVATDLLLHTRVHDYHAATSGAGSDADRAGP
ncbi:hypothetical protein HNR67_006662 [Crossiella cryophila]|uniref:Uncharacterized protein n=1 Tax=Crossiella cryophila TaxID=43355 RepID=A0A7W7FYX8_9PSEU|nr:hypothetical protein [Crossiella cryophila]